MPDAKRRFAVLQRLEFFGFMLLADPDFCAQAIQAKDALALEDGLGAIRAIRKAETLYAAINLAEHAGT